MKYINDRKEFINKSKVSEAFDMSGGSGPMGNDINWGDSLVGRLFNSIFRKAGVAVDSLKLEGVIKRLRSEFEAMYNMSKIEGEDVGKLHKVKISYLFELLTNAVFSGDSIDELIRIAETTVNSVKGSNLNDVHKNQAIKELEDFIKFLKQQDDIGVDIKLYHIMLKNLESLKLILDNYKDVGKPIIGNIYKYTNKEGKKHDVKLFSINSDGETAVVLFKDRSDKFAIKKGVYLSQLNKKSIIKESVVIIGDLKTRKAFLNLKKSIEILTSDKYNNLSVDSKLIGDILNEKYKRKDDIIKLYKRIKWNYEKNPAVQTPGPLYESLLSDENESESLAIKIARFSKRAMQFKGDSNIITELGNLKNPLLEFVETFDSILNTGIGESKIFKYKHFMLLNENLSDLSIKIKEYYEQNVSYDKWIIEKAEVDELDSKIESGEPVKVKKDNIIEIVKLFNRAYKIYTTEVIPSGRKDGKVSNKVYREYEYMGSSGGPSAAGDGGIKPGYGPFRHKKLFNRFESVVLDIIKETKYQKMFSENVKVGVKEVPGNGKILLKFITSLLDGKQLYKAGAQSKFLQEYFGFKIDDTQIGSGSFDKPKKSPDKPEVKKKDGTFEPVKGINMNISRSFHIFESGGKNYIIFVIKKDNDKFYFKLSEKAGHFKEYWKDSINVSVNNETSKVLYCQTDKEEIKEGQSLTAKTFDISKWDDNHQYDTTENLDLGDIKNIKSLKVDGQLFKLNSAISTYGGKGDSSKYSDLKKKLG